MPTSKHLLRRGTRKFLQMLRTHLLYNDVIESDGRISKEPTLLGAILIGIAFIAGFALLVVLAGQAGLL